MATKKILIVEDDPLLARALRRQFQSRGYETLGAETIAGALAIYDQSVDLIITDNDLGSKNDGVVLIGYLRSLGHGKPIILTSGYDLETIRADCRAKGLPQDLITHFVPKVDNEALTRLVEKLLGGR